MKIRAILPILLAVASLFSAICMVTFNAVGIAEEYIHIFGIISTAILFTMMVVLAPIPLAWCPAYLEKIKKTGAVHYTNAEAAQSILKEGFIRPSNRLSSYSNLFRRCTYLAHPSYKEVTLAYNKMKGKVDKDSVEIFVPYNEEAFAKAKFRLVDMSIMIPGGIKL